MTRARWSLLACLLLSSALVPRAQEASKLWDKAEALKGDGEYAKALKFYEKLADSHADSAIYHASAGVCLCELNEVEEAFKAFNHAFGIDQQNPRLYIYRAECFRRFGELDKAVHDYTEGLNYADSDTLKQIMYVNRGSLKGSYRDIEGSLADYLIALDLDSSDLAVRNNIGLTYGELGMNDEAIYHLQKVIQLDSSFEGGLMNLGFLYSEMEEYELALETLNKAIDKFPDMAVAYNNRGMVKHHLGHTNEGINDIKHSLKLYEANSYAYRNLAIIYGDTQKMDKACENCLKAIKLGFSTTYGSEMKKFYADKCGD